MVMQPPSAPNGVPPTPSIGLTDARLLYAFSDDSNIVGTAKKSANIVSFVP